jgi:hypothetical protein
MPLPTKPISEKKLAANRANAAHSTGPRSPEGKTRSAQNSRKHGLTASTFTVVRLEELDEVAHLRDDAIAFYQPVNSQEIFAVERIALAQQSILRAARLEAGTATNCMNEAFDGSGRPNVQLSSLLINKDNEITRPQNRNFLFAEGFHRLSRQSNSISLFLRYQAHAERQYRRAIEEFNRLKALRKEMPNEATMNPQPEATEPLNPPETTPQATPAGNILGLPPRFRPDGEPFLVSPLPDSPSDEPEFAST